MIIYTDGSAHPNPGPGGFGVIALDDNENLIHAYSKQFDSTVTNNEMEIKAILYALIQYGKLDETVLVYSDSNYCVQTFNNWIFNWARQGWLKADNKSPENLELIKAYYELCNKGYRIDLRKIKGHSNHQWNELADKLATGKITSEEVYKLYGTKQKIV